MCETKKITILAISGSLRVSSSNTAILRAIALISPAHVEIHLYNGLSDLPHFSPELDGENSPKAVKNLRLLLSKADGIIMCTPEYAYGMPGSLKNALDWTVSSGEFYEKLVVVISASPSHTGGDKALASLLLVLSALGAIEAGRLPIPAVNKKMNDKKEVTDPETIELLKTLLQTLVDTIKAKV